MPIPFAALALAAGMAATPPAADPCFRSQDYRQFRPVDAHAFIVRANVDQFYRIEVAGTCQALLYPQAVLVTTVRGGPFICGPTDWDLKVAQSGSPGSATGCIVKSQRRMTAAEVAALPPGQKP